MTRLGKEEDTLSMERNLNFLGQSMPGHFILKFKKVGRAELINLCLAGCYSHCATSIPVVAAP